MSLAVLAFAAGVLLLQFQAALPAQGWLLLVLPSAAAACWCLRREWGLGACAAACACGFLWAAGFAHLRIVDRLDPSLEGRDLEVLGVVSSLPAASERSLRFEFDVESEARGARLPSKLLLSWYRTPLVSGVDADPGVLEEVVRVHPGERWSFRLRLRRPHGSANPFGFDYEAWLLERGIGATGYVRGASRKLGERTGFMDRVERAREAVRERFLAVLGVSPASGVLVALAVGDQRAISNEEWRLFNRTGVTHLMSISGLHVTLISGLFAALVSFGWRRVARFALALPARKAAAIAAVAAAFGYSLLAGFAVPAQRTCFMVAVVAAALWTGQIASGARVLALALGAVLLADPWAVLAPGFWLSFGAVALIFYVTLGRTRAPSAWVQWGRIQWAITLGLAPAALLIFAQVSLVGPLANAVAIPLVSAVITPLALAAAVVPWNMLLDFAQWIAQWMFVFLEWCAALPLALWQQHVPPAWAVLMALAGVAWLLAPRGVPSRWTGALLFAPVFLIEPPHPAPGEAWLTTLDVGQGLALVVRTEQHALLYDAGPLYGPEADGGERVVVPYLRATGVRSLDAMVLTHNDSDHTGGAASVLANVDTARVLSSLAPGHPLHALASESMPCLRGASWNWDGVRFEFLHPASIAAGGRAHRNNLSCVLRVATPHGAMLLTGDIERATEGELLEATEALAAEALLVPHHGSRTSSTPEFVAAVAPRYAVVPAGYRNRFGHPRSEVLGRYAALGAQILRTDLDGAVTLRFAEGGVRAETARGERPRYWHPVR
ncbi:MAG: DNA internalization-related competence protein ComEC/Rec2 [Betaproteobacteria bacterium]|nr:DNA internalization-related competence protein ComEC/Rec2 [Betaproteobacteria bacterium]